MENFIEKISSYDLLNNILPGAIFCFLLDNLFNIDILKGGIIENLFIYYFAGMIISRFGSLILEPIYKKLKIIKFSSYDDFIRASTVDAKINILLESTNLYRTMFSMCVILLFIKLYLLIENKVDWINYNSDSILLIFLFILFAMSYKKQCSFIQYRVIYTNKLKVGKK